MSRRTIIAATAAALLCAVPLAAQPTFPTNDPVLQRIWRLGMDSSQTPRLAHALLDSVGPRLTGTPGMKAASDWVISTYKSWGIDGRAEPYGTWRGWRRGHSHIDLMQPRVRSLEGMMLAWSPGTGGRDVTGEVVTLPATGDSASFARWLAAARGKYVLMSPALPTCRASDNWARYGTPASFTRMQEAMQAATQDHNRRVQATGMNAARLNARLDSAGVAGVITSQPTISYATPGGGRGRGAGAGAPPAAAGRGGAPAQPQAPQGSGGWGVVRVFDTQNRNVPAVSLSCEDYGLLHRLAESGSKPVVRMNLDGELLGEVPAFNTIGMIKGTEKPDEYVMLSAHFDSWDGGSGATDNGTGTIMMMEAMRILKQAYPNPKRTILVGHWNSEEQGLNGSRAWAEDHPEVIKGLQALFNQDNGTGRVLSVSASGLKAIGPQAGRWFDQLPSFFTDSGSRNRVRFNFRDTLTVSRPGGTDGSVFSCHGTPSFGMSAESWDYNGYTWHTNRDTYDKVVFDDLKHNATLVAMLAYMAANDPQFIARELSPGAPRPADWPAICQGAPRSFQRR